MSTVAAEQALALSVADRGSALLELSEDQWFERKSNRIQAKDLANDMIGFANAEGGMIVIGLWNDVVEGVGGATKRRPDWQQAALDYTVPAVPCRQRAVECINQHGERDQLVLVEVETSEKVHTNRKDQVFLRVGDETRKLTFVQRQELLYDKGQATFESTMVQGAERTDLDASLLDSYATALNHPDPDRLLAARGLSTRDGELTVASVLLFAEHPQTWFPEASVRVLRYQGLERGTGARQRLLDDIRIEGPIPVQLNEARQALFDRLPTRRALGSGGRFEQVGLIPRDAWLEGLVNAVVHRSYSISGDHIRIEVFDDRVEIESPGRFPGIADAGDPLHMTRFARNPRIARVCADLHFGQELGEGIRRMYEEMRLAGLADPVYHQTSGSVRVTLSATPVDRALEARLPPGSRDLVRIIRESTRASTGDIVQAAGRSRPVVIRQLKALQEAGIIDWIGHSHKDPRAYWTLHIE
jgi:ATP-dependent DNA helicase RecG